MYRRTQLPAMSIQIFRFSKREFHWAMRQTSIIIGPDRKLLDTVGRIVFFVAKKSRYMVVGAFPPCGLIGRMIYGFMHVEEEGQLEGRAVR